MIKELPIIDNPWIQTYQIRNFELGILQNQVPWIYGKYINCCCHKKSFTHCIGSHGRFFTKDNAMLMQKFKFDKSIFENSNWNFVEFVKNMIDHQWYVLGDFDEYYIRVKDAYKNCHFRHWAFIYGYDDLAETFFTIGYTRGGKYKKYVMSFDEYNNAIKVEFDQESDKYVKKHIDRIEFYAVKINPQYSEFGADFVRSVNTRFLQNCINSNCSFYFCNDPRTAPITSSLHMEYSYLLNYYTNLWGSAYLKQLAGLWYFSPTP